MTDIVSLIERLEKASGPDWQLDAAIARLDWYREAAGDCADDEVPQFTSSIDAALTLVPPWSWRVGNLPSGRGFADLGTQRSLQCVEGATPALALCIAALKARRAA